jgi:hypothetical protein
MPYSAEIFAPDGTPQGSLDLDATKDDAQAQALARTRGEEWLRDCGFDHATVQISCDGRGLSPLELSR